LDKATSELVQRSTFQAYGGSESDYRPERWKNFREDYRFTGKEEDVEVGLQYFGRRYYSSSLLRWVSLDPLEVHTPGNADFNLYAYVLGQVLQNTDPLGLQDTKPETAVAVVLSGGTDPHLKAMDRFSKRNYGSPDAAKPVTRTNSVGTDELRRTVPASGKSAISMLDDVGKAAKRLASDPAKAKAISMIVHGNSTGFGRALKGEWITAETLRSVISYRDKLSKMENSLDKVKRDMEKNPVGWPPNEIADRQNEIEQFKANNHATGKISDALTGAAGELAKAGVSRVDVVGCDGGNDLLFMKTFGSLLSTKENKVNVGAFTNDILSDVPKGEFIGVRTPGGGITQKSYTTLPTPDKN
jgi:RHS repeat-associated protein